MSNLLARIAGRCVERPAPVLATVVLLALIGAVAALRLEAESGTESLVDRDSKAFAATEDFKREFGDEAVAVLLEGDLERLVSTENLGTLLALEGCLAGNLEPGQAGAPQNVPEPCTELAESQPAQVVYGPATFLNQAAIQTSNLLGAEAEAVVREARRAARRASAAAREQGLSRSEQKETARATAQEVITAFQQQLLGEALRLGLTGLPSIDDQTFVNAVVFDNRRPGQPKARFADLFPSPSAALISVRLRPDLSDAERRETIDLIREALGDRAFRIQNSEYVVSGVPVVADGLAQAISDEIFVLLAVALAVMVVTLALVFGPPLRLLPLAIALLASALTFGGLAVFGGSLTMASVAVLPVLIGLAVDYAIQFQARFTEAVRAGSRSPRAAVAAAAAGGPVIGVAALATGAGFLVLLLSPIPQVRGFGVLLVIGIGLAFALALTAGLAILSLTGRGGVGAGGLADRARNALPGGPEGRIAAAARRVGSARARGGERLRGLGRRALGTSIAAPGATVAIAAVLAIGGWVAGTRTEVISDLRELVPAELPALRDVDELQDVTGQSGRVEVAVTAPDLTDPEVIAWMGDFKARVLEVGGFEGQPTACAEQDARICPSVALADLFTDQKLTQQRIQGVVEILPRYFAQAFVSRDENDALQTATIPFGIKVMPFDEQKELIDGIRAEIDPEGSEKDPPAGVEAEVVGLPVLAADANSALEGNTYLLAGAGLAAVALVLLAVYRSLRRALVPLVPILFATGWSALVLWIAGVPLNPMSATLGALVIAIATEFSVLLSARYEEERRGGHTLGEALRRAYARTGAAVAASGVTSIAGFAALIATDIRMLRDFGLVTVLDLTVALVGVLLVLPAALALMERRFATTATSPEELVPES